MIPMTPIRWDLVAEAIRFYRVLKYEYLEVPWVVSEAALSATLPPYHEATRCQDGPLVGSAEQSFMHMMLEGTLKPGRWQAATPCFRDDVEDEFHQRRFFKVELINYFGPASTVPQNLHELLWHMVDDALFFYKQMGGVRRAVARPTGQHMVDIEVGGIELGSYGFRTIEGHSWIYGTGFADPRFSIAMAKSHE